MLATLTPILTKTLQNTSNPINYSSFLNILSNVLCCLLVIFFIIIIIKNLIGISKKPEIKEKAQESLNNVPITIQEKNNNWLIDRNTINRLRALNPEEFELFIVELFDNLGYKARHVGGSRDGGVDVIAEKDDVKHYIQCKKFITREVKLGDVRDFYGALADHLAGAQGYFITTNKFTLDAWKYAENKPIELIDSFRLIEYMKLAEDINKGKYKFPETEDGKSGINIDEGFAFKDVSSPDINRICPRCGGYLVLRESKRTDFRFYGCSNFPKCWYKRYIKQK